MAFDQRCYDCFNRAVSKLLSKEDIEIGQAEEFAESMKNLYMVKKDEFSSPMFARELHVQIKEITKNSDPYKVGKKESNDLILGMYSSLQQKIKQAENSFEMALRLAISGNIIDFAVNEHYNINETIEKVLNSDFAINDSLLLQKELQNAKSVLYLGDNNGEIVFDKLFIETIDHPNLTYAVRGAPIINDATLEDANYVGLDKIVPVISNGYDAPSTILDKCSDEFIHAYQNADVIISKGQGNLEGLLHSKSGNIFFLLMVKCDVIAETLRVQKGDFVVKKVEV